MADLRTLIVARRLLRGTARRQRDLAIWRAISPVIILLSLYLLAALLGVFEQAPRVVAALMSLIVIAGLVYGGVQGARRFANPGLTEARRLLDAQSELRPLVSLQDRPIASDPVSMALWRAHERQLLRAARRLTVPSFASAWRQADPFYLRAILPLSLLCAVGFNWDQMHARLGSALMPDYGSLLGADKIAVEAWITPPDYTGRAPIYVKPNAPVVQIPEGSIMTLRAVAPGAPELRLLSDQGLETHRFVKTPDGAFQASASLSGYNEVSVAWWGERNTWQITAQSDTPPSVRFDSDPEHTPTDRTRFNWSAQDDYGVQKLELAIRPIGRGIQADRVDIDWSGVGRREIETRSSLDLTQNRWAGAQVEIWLIATDGAGQTGRSESFVFELPDRLMILPLAKAIQDARLTLIRDDTDYTVRRAVQTDLLRQGHLTVSASQRLSRAPAGVQRAATMLDAISYNASAYIKDILLYAGLETARYTLETASSRAEARLAEPLLWALALRAEYGSAADAYAALMAAKKALENALRDGASEADIRRLMEAFKDAAQRYVAAKLAEALGNLQSAPDSTDSAQGPGGGALGGDTFSDMLDALEDLTETGASDQARQLLSDITNMLENLQFQQGNGSGDGFPGLPGEQNAESGEAIPEAERELSETMQELLDLLREQRQLNDETLARQRGETGQSQEGASGEQRADSQGAEAAELPMGDTAPSAPSERDLAERQRDLAERLGDLRDEAEAGMGIGETLDEDILQAIERAQRRAGNALEDANEGRAIRNQEQATRQLRDITEDLAEVLDALEGARRGDDRFDPSGRTADPFGNLSNSGVDDRNSIEIPDQLERDRARDILEELRRRYGETEDAEEREYLDRLLDRF